MSEAAGDAKEMRIDPARAKLLAENLEHVVKRVDSVRGSRKVYIYHPIIYRYVEEGQETDSGRFASSPSRS